MLSFKWKHGTAESYPIQYKGVLVRYCIRMRLEFVGWKDIEIWYANVLGTQHRNSESTMNVAIVSNYHCFHI